MRRLRPIIAILIILLGSVSLIWFLDIAITKEWIKIDSSVKANINKRPKIEKPVNIEPILTTDWSSKEYAQSVLFKKVEDQADQKILSAIIHCESTWRHYDSDGEVLTNLGNIGFGQINDTVWGKWFEYNFDLDLYDPKDNLEAVIVLYEWQGLAPWMQWSGPCFVPLLEKQGIYL